MEAKECKGCGDVVPEEDVNDEGYCSECASERNEQVDYKGTCSW
jgi:hypothetical protein